MPASNNKRLEEFDAATAHWKSAFGGCSQMLETLARATDDDGRATARLWWTICMASKVDQCKGPYGEWKAEANAALPKQITSEHTRDAVSLSAFEPMAQCLLNAGAAVGVDPGVTLDTVENYAVKAAANNEWSRAINDVEALRTKLQQNFLAKKPSLHRIWSGLLGPAEGTLAKSAGEMQIDELRVCQVWMYGLASRLRSCRGMAGDFAAAAGMSDPNSPLQGYDEARWDPNSPPWQAMEDCVHQQAAGAGTTADAAWRRPLAKS